MPRAAIARWRAPTVYAVRIETIRTKYTVQDKGNKGLRLSLSKILDYARMCLSSVRNRGSARTGRRPRKAVTFRCGIQTPVADFGSNNRFDWTVR
jgi:hypothetical protein